MKQLISAFVLALGVFSAGMAAQAAALLTVINFDLHGFDKQIPKTLGYDTASVVYLKEMGSLTDNELSTRKKYETIGCYPFYVMREGKVEEAGYNCGSFYCTGYQKGPKQCRDRDGAAYGGVVEIQSRLNNPASDQKKFFADFPAIDQTTSMKNRVTNLNPLQCKPFYLFSYDIAVGEGYDCNEVGRYPFYSPKNTCINDWRTKDGPTCTSPLRSNETQIREQAIALRGRPPSRAIRSSVRGTSEGTPTSLVISFPDVKKGQYGYDAIRNLAAAGVVRGYRDGSFKPEASINRAEFASLLLRALGKKAMHTDTPCFKDLDDEWAKDEVCTAKDLGWVQGLGNGKFLPHRTISKAESIKMILNALRMPLTSSATLPDGIPATAWYTPSVRKAIELRILPDGAFQPLGQASRADAAVWLAHARSLMDNSSSR